MPENRKDVIVVQCRSNIVCELNLKNFGAKADGIYNNAAAFAEAVSVLHEAGGGTLTVPAGIWKTGPIRLCAKMTLHLAEGAVLRFIPDPELYPPVYTRWEGVECYAMQACLYCADSDSVTVTGKGVIDGSGDTWWDLRWQKADQGGPKSPIECKLAALNPGYRSQPGGGGGREVQFLRPALVQFYNCTNVRLEQVTLENSPFWTVHPVYCDNLLVRGITIQNPKDAPNTDGIDIDSCTNVQIVDCEVSVGDDGIALKSGSGEDGIRVNRPTRNVTVRGCTVRDAHGGMVIGSETAAGIRHVLAENCRFPGTDRGVRIKSRRGRGGEIYDVKLRNLVMEDNLCPIAINMYYKCGETDPKSPLFSLDAQPVTDSTPHVHDVEITGVRASGCKASAGFIAGLPESPVGNLVIKDCVFRTDERSPESPMNSDMFYGLPEVAEKSFRVLNAPGALFENVRIEGPSEPFVYG